ncbi:MAG: PAS domain S-box protein, partial [Blastocatellia bacterium]|nr:PAS domain S-box protein [Blastocatellia bacterium]
MLCADRSPKYGTPVLFSGDEVNYDAVLDYESIGERFIHGSYTSDVGPDGQVRGFYAMINDLTELKRSESALRASEHRMRLLAENVRDYAIFTTDEEGVIDTWNIGAENIFGYRAEEILGQNAEVLFTSEDRARGIPMREMRLAKRNLRAADERWHVRKDGSRFFASGVV